MGDTRSRAHAKIAALPGVRSVRRPVTPQSGEQFDLYYVRSGPPSDRPLVIVPGGPGMASVAPYQGLRRRLAETGLDVIMVEHRGVGLSRRDDAGADLPAEGLTIAQVVDDLAAVLDDAGVDAAVAYGTSYGSYLAAGLGARHPGRVHAMVLDSPLLNRNDFELVRQEARALFWHDDSDIAAKMRELTERGALLPEDLTLAAAVYGFGGPEILDSHLGHLLERRHLLWTAAREIMIFGARKNVPFHSEGDLVAPIGFRELNFAGTPDGLPLDTTLTWRGVPGADIPFEAEPFDLVAAMPQFHWPTVILSGGRDLITPPAVADRIAELVPRGSLVRLPTATHSVLDLRDNAAIRIIGEVMADRADALPAQGGELDAVPAGPSIRLLKVGLTAVTPVAGLLPRIGRATS